VTREGKVRINIVFVKTGYLNGGIVRARENAVFRGGEGAHGAAVPLQGGQALQRVHIPDADGLIVRSAKHATGRVNQSADRPGVPLKRLHLPQALDIPHLTHIHSSTSRQTEWSVSQDIAECDLRIFLASPISQHHHTKAAWTAYINTAKNK
jgi:hypothetical protein